MFLEHKKSSEINQSINFTMYQEENIPNRKFEVIGNIAFPVYYLDEKIKTKQWGKIENITRRTFLIRSFNEEVENRKINIRKNKKRHENDTASKNSSLEFDEVIKNFTYEKNNMLMPEEKLKVNELFVNRRF